MGSVKDLTIESEAKEKALGIGSFIFSNRYSVFDWGEMPNHIEKKGASLALMSAWNFERLEKNSIDTHYMGLSPEATDLNGLKKPTNIMKVLITRVIKPELRDKKYDYSFFRENKGNIDNYLIPLEVVYRNGLPKGSSVFKKLESGKIKPEDLGFKSTPKPGDMLPETKHDFWTKLEPSDRPLSEEDAYIISGLSKKEFERLKGVLKICNDVITERCNEVGLINYDGKIEFFKFAPNIYVCDVLGTLDENRFAMAEGDLKGEQVSKEFLRQWYKKNDVKWIDNIARAKELAEDKGVKNWKDLCTVGPRPLPKELSDLLSQMYMSSANLYVGREMFDSPPLETVMIKLRKYK